MSLPVAGRRKGLATTAAPPSAPESSGAAFGGSHEPDWLFGDQEKPAPSPAPLGSSSVAHQGVGASSFTASPAAGISLSPQAAPSNQTTSADFLDFLEMGGAGSSAPPPRAVATPAVVPAPSSHGAAQLGPPKSDTLSFLDDLAGDLGLGVQTVQAPASDVTVAATAQAAAAALEARRREQQASKAELQALEQEIAAVSLRIEGYTAKRHEICAEVERMDSEIGDLKKKEEEAAAREVEMQEHLKEEAREEAVSSTAEIVASRMAVYRAEVEEAYKREMETLSVDLGHQESCNASLRKSYKEAAETSLEQQCYIKAMSSLEEHFAKRVAKLKAQLNGESRSTLSRCFCDFLGRARQQRTDIFTADRHQYRQLLEAHQKSRAAGLAEFSDICRAKYQANADRLFGVLKESLAAIRREQHGEQVRRMHDFGASLSIAVQQHRTMLEQQLLHQSQEAQRALSQLASSGTKEAKGIAEEHRRQFVTFQTRAQREKQAFVEGRAVTQRLQKTGPLSAMRSAAVVQEGLRRNVGLFQQGLTQLLYGVRTELEVVKASMRRQAKPAFSPCNAPLLSEREERWRRSCSALQSVQESLRRSTLNLRDIADGCESSTQAAHQRIREAHGAQMSLRSTWEGDIQGLLSRCFTPDTEDISFPGTAAVSTTVMESVTQQLHQLLTQQQALRNCRISFTSQFGDSISILRRYRDETSLQLSGLLSQMSTLQKNSAKVEAAEHIISYTEKQTADLRGQTNALAQQIKEKRRSIEAQTKQLCADYASLVTVSREDGKVAKRIKCMPELRQTRIYDELSPKPKSSHVDWHSLFRVSADKLRKNRDSGVAASRYTSDEAASQSPLTPDDAVYSHRDNKSSESRNGIWRVPPSLSPTPVDPMEHDRRTTAVPPPTNPISSDADTTNYGDEEEEDFSTSLVPIGDDEEEQNSMVEEVERLQYALSASPFSARHSMPPYR